MARQRNAFKLGAATLLMVGLFIAVLVFISGRHFGPPTQSIIVRFASTLALPALQEGSPVFCGGREVGSVENVRFEEDASGTPAGEAPPLYVYVQASVQKELALRRDCKITASGPLLGGTGQVVIRDRGKSTELLPDGGTVEGQAPGSFSAVTEALSRELDANSPGSLLAQIKTQLDPADAASLISKIHQSMDDVNRITMRISRQLDPAERDVVMTKLNSILDHINAATGLLEDELVRTNDAALMAKVHASIDTLDAGLKVAVAMLEDSREPVGQTLANIQRMSEELDRNVVAQIIAELEPDQPANLMAKIHASLDRVVTALDDVTVISADGREMVQLNKHNINSALDNFKTASDLLKGGLKYVVRHPWVLFNKPDVAEQQDLGVMEAARQFAEASGRLDDTMASLEALMTARGETIAPGDEQLTQLRFELDEAMAKFNSAETQLWEQLSVK